MHPWWTMVEERLIKPFLPAVLAVCRCFSNKKQQNPTKRRCLKQKRQLKNQKNMGFKPPKFWSPIDFWLKKSVRNHQKNHRIFGFQGTMVLVVATLEVSSAGLEEISRGDVKSPGFKTKRNNEKMVGTCWKLNFENHFRIFFGSKFCSLMFRFMMFDFFQILDNLVWILYKKGNIDCFSAVYASLGGGW